MSLEAKFETLAIHADAWQTSDVAPPLHVASTYKYADGFNDAAARRAGLLPPVDADYAGPLPVGDEHIYSRLSTDTRRRAETVIGALEGGKAVTYASGLAAATAAFLHVQPKRIFSSREGYYGVRGAMAIYVRTKPSVQVFHLEEEDAAAPYVFEEGDLIWLEMPQNPRGEVYDIRAYAARKPAGATIGVDSTFAPPPLQYCLQAGADIVMHSCTKYFGGHSDLLAGVLIVKDEQRVKQLFEDRDNLGNTMGNMEAWLLLRSLRTHKLRVLKQSETATNLATWLNSLITGTCCKEDEEALSIVERVWHGSVPGQPGHEVIKREGWGYSPCMSIQFKSPHHARLVVPRFKYIINATSLGGVDSLIEWRYGVDPKIHPGVCRFSVGLEAFEDLKADLKAGFLEVKALVSSMPAK
ncbi:Cys/Met metabolism PLP-dependent enzyme-domain-containing protein [Cladochytrium replicatum]|nr:Cys/Met metabolism PLP-dependent enzyme-domain-containing protein [Cladochytrium replicatum]